jgi:antitoxin CptB
MADAELLDDKGLSRLQWACRRGLLENDLFIQRFFQQHGRGLNMRRARGLQCLMDLPDTELLDLLLRRTELPAGLDRPEVAEVLSLMRRPAPSSSTEGKTP